MLELANSYLFWSGVVINVLGTAFALAVAWSVVKETFLDIKAEGRRRKWMRKLRDERAGMGAAE